MTKNSLYIHIPFCRSICAYCDFPKILLLDKYIDPYIDALFFELETLPHNNIKTIYIGGGTPLSLNEKELEKLLSKLNDKFDLKSLEEFTIETTPIEVTEEKLLLLKKYNVTRLSIGVETLDTTLPYLNRVTSKEVLLNLYNLLKKTNFINYNFDLIYGWPNSSIEKFLNDLKFIISLNPTHISLYPLAIEEGTKLYNIKLQPIEDDLYAEYYELAKNALKENGFNRYEVSNFSKCGYESKHNLTYWNGEDYLALGLGATSFYDGHRITRTRSLTKYLNHDYYALDEKEDIEEIKNDYIMLNLRLDNGFKLEDYKKKFKNDFLLDYKEKIEKVKEYLIINSESVRVKENYIYILDSILIDLLK